MNEVDRTKVTKSIKSIHPVVNYIQWVLRVISFELLNRKTKFFIKTTID